MSHTITWTIACIAIAAMIIKPFRIAEAIWPITGALLLILLGEITLSETGASIMKGMDVYFFLAGMMLLSETAREEKLFDWMAIHATRLARGNSLRLFLLIYTVGTIVTIFLSNDATAVVLTPAVAAAMRTAKIEKPLPYLLICAFIANAASFVLPISNPANLVIYEGNMPALAKWLSLYALPSLVSIVVTFLMLWLSQRNSLQTRIVSDILAPDLSATGKMALGGIIATAIVLLVVSALGVNLGLPTLITGVITSMIVLIRAKKSPVTVLRGISWSVIPLVAGLFILVAAVDKTGLTDLIAAQLRSWENHSVNAAVWLSGFTIAIASNIFNNLPVGLVAGNVIHAGQVSSLVKSSLLIGVDLGPNLSVTGSLATILWLAALRREGLMVSAGRFLRIGIFVMTAALIASLAALLL